LSRAGGGRGWARVVMRAEVHDAQEGAEGLPWARGAFDGMCQELQMIAYLPEGWQARVVDRLFVSRRLQTLFGAERASAVGRREGRGTAQGSDWK